MTAPWLLVAGDLTPLGGMDVANYALARHLATTGGEVHLVTHRAWPDLAALPGITVHQVWRPFGRHLLGSPLLSSSGQSLWRRLQRRGARTIVNGGNCPLPGVNWIHYLHAAYEPGRSASKVRQAKTEWTHARDLAAERAAIRSARLVISNSARTKRDIVERIGIDASRVHVVYYGIDPHRFGPITWTERAAARRWLGEPGERPLIGFVGALGDRRKAFDTVFEAWSALCRRRDWDAKLVVAGAGAELDFWQSRTHDAGLDDRITFLGFRHDVPEILAGLDALVHPARYEAYGLSVHEALCRGIPAIASAIAGVAERYPADLADLLIEDPDSSGELAARLLTWHRNRDEYRRRTVALSTVLRQSTWDGMAATIADLAGAAA